MEKEINFLRGEFKANVSLTFLKQGKPLTTCSLKVKLLEGNKDSFRSFVNSDVTLFPCGAKPRRSKRLRFVTGNQMT